MKVKPIYLVDQRAKKLALSQLMDDPADGTTKVVFSAAKDKSARQRGLQFIWYGDVIKAGVGGLTEGDVKRLHLASKYRWCLVIQIRDDEDFAALWLDYWGRWEGNPAKLEWFVDRFVSTEALNQSQMAEYLTEFQRHYADNIGVNLSDPNEYGWRNLLETKPTTEKSE